MYKKRLSQIFQFGASDPSRGGRRRSIDQSTEQENKETVLREQQETSSQPDSRRASTVSQTVKDQPEQGIGGLTGKQPYGKIDTSNIWSKSSVLNGSFLFALLRRQCACVRVCRTTHSVLYHNNKEPFIVNKSMRQKYSKIK